jgi:hypothetical protein
VAVAVELQAQVAQDKLVVATERPMLVTVLAQLPILEAEVVELFAGTIRAVLAVLVDPVL